MKCWIFILLLASIVIPVAQQTLAEGQMWGNDVLVHQADHIYGFGLDQGDKDTLLLVVSDSSTANTRDTTYIYRSTDNGQTWNYATCFYPGVDNRRYGKADIIATKGDSNFVFIFWIGDSETQRVLWYIRYGYDFTGPVLMSRISLNENVVDFDVCQDLYSNYWLYVVFQTDQDSVIFTTSRDYGKSWQFRKNLSEITPITGQPKVAWSQGPYIVVAGIAYDDSVYTIRNDNSGRDDAWKDGQRPTTHVDARNPALAATHTSPDSEAVFWVFYELPVYTPFLHYELRFHWSTDAGQSWFITSQPSDTSSGNRLYPSLHVLKENEAQNVTLAYRYEGTSPRQIRNIYKSNGQINPSVWMAPYSGINDYSPHHTPHQKAYTLRGTDNSVRSAVLYVRDILNDLYFDASAFTAVEDEAQNRTIDGFSLDQNYPNPFNPSTRIEFEIPENGWVSLEIYNIMGQKVRQLLTDYLERGLHRITWDGKDDNGEALANGVYFYRLQASDITETKKMILLK
jgi:hypothetical protein